MIWNRSNTIGLARASCSFCKGEGIIITEKRQDETVCNCVLRAIFRCCYERFRECVAAAGSVHTVAFEVYSGPIGQCVFSRKNEEYIADFSRIARQSLDDLEHGIFRRHFLYGQDWRLCANQVRMDRGTFFHAIYRIQQRLGRAFAEIEPYALFPTDAYFSIHTGGMNYGRKLPGNREGRTMLVAA